MANAFYIASTALQTLFIIFFIFQFLNKKSMLRTPYFIIYAFGLVGSVITNFDWIFYGFLPIPISKTIIVYSFVFPVTLHATLIINRCTALWFPLRLHKIWNFQNTFAVILLNLLLPYIMFGFYFYRLYFLKDSKAQERANEHTNSLIQIYFTTTSNILIIITVIFCSKRSITTFSKKFAAIEKRLIYQSIIVLLLVQLDCLFWKIDHIIDISIPYEDPIIQALYTFADCIIPIYQLLDIFILFIISESFRASVLKFFSFGLYREKVIMVTSVTHTGNLSPRPRSTTNPPVYGWQNV